MTGGQERNFITKVGTITLPDGTIIHFVDPEPDKRQWPDKVPTW